MHQYNHYSFRVVSLLLISCSYDSTELIFFYEIFLFIYGLWAITTHNHSRYFINLYSNLLFVYIMRYAGKSKPIWSQQFRSVFWDKKKNDILKKWQRKKWPMWCEGFVITGHGTWFSIRLWVQLIELAMQPITLST